MKLGNLDVWSMYLMVVVVGISTGSAREIHVAKTGDDSAAGSRQHPYSSINRAAETARPGDVVTVHAGTYREWVKPLRGGTDDEHRIVFRAADGEEVIVKGSEEIDTWRRAEGNVWKVVLPNTFFGDYNPYALQVSGGWLNYGQWHHRGDVYLNGKAFREKQTLEAVQQASHSWYCKADDASTMIWANFGSADPNTEVAEINVRESLFMPTVTGLNYITVDGFRFFHAAANWAPPVVELQTGAIGPRMGKEWIIQNCTISDIRCVGIILGQAPGADYRDIDSFGAHVVRDNVIRRCGQAGIAGQKGATRSLITGNLIEETNYRKEFGGWETAGIKFHNSVDTVIQKNLIREVYHQKQGAFGIWIDFGNQGTRITSNVIYDTQAAALFLEMNHGPILVDNNIMVGGGFRSNSENTVLVHNFLVDCPIAYNSDTNRRSQYFVPHTTKIAGRKVGVPQNEKWYNNIFAGSGLSRVNEGVGFAADYNLYLGGARKSEFGDEHSIVDPFQIDLKIGDRPSAALIHFKMTEKAFHLKPPGIDAEYFGIFPTVNQAMEDRNGTPIQVERDLQGQLRSRPLVGPLADLQKGTNKIHDLCIAAM
ncbi:MAG: right-handed parallel beta-helix repeat-containing protein [Pirellulaceae bacterium]